MLWIGIGAGVAVVVAVIVVLASLAAVSKSSTSSSTSVNVTAINFTSGDDACGTNGGGWSGFTTSGGGSVQETLVIANSDLFASCMIDSVSATTSGFSISGANVPLEIDPGTQEDLNFTITAPSGSYTGVLTIDFE